MAVRAGQAFIVIAPSFKGFKTKTDTWVKTNVKAIDVQVNPVLSKKPIVMKPQKPVNVKVDADRSAFDRSMRAIESRLDRLTRGRFLINVGIALSPIAAPMLAAAVGGAVAAGGIGAAGIAGVVGMAAVGAASLSRLTEAQDAVTKATDAGAAASKALQGARESLASAERSAAATRIAAERSVTDARRSAARSISDAERSVADAQKGVVESQERVRRSLADLHDARQQAVRDLDELRERSVDSALTTEGAEIGLIDAQAELARVQKDVKATALDLRKAKLGVAEAENRLSDARRDGADSAAKLADAEAGGPESNAGVVDARKALDNAQKDQAKAERSVRIAQRDEARVRRDARREISEARADASRQVSDANRAVALAGADLAVAQTAASAAQVEQARALAALSPVQKVAAEGIDRLKTSWAAFQDKTDPYVLPALVKGMDALAVGLGPLAAFMAPVSAAAGLMFDAFGKALGSDGFSAWSTSFGEFSAGIAGDAAQGIINLTTGFGNLLTAFMPLSTSMSGGLVTLTQRFADWTAGLGESDRFNAFIDYVRENGPLLLSTIGDIVDMLIEVGIAVSPLATKMLEGIGAVASLVAEFAAANPEITMAIVGFIALSSGLAAVAGPLARMTSLVGAAGKGVIGLASGTRTAFVAGKDFVGGMVNQKNALKNGASWATTFGSATRQGATNTMLAVRSTASFVVAQASLGLAYLRNIAASALITTGMIAQRVATLAVSGATRAWAAGQWLLNAALTANPIGLVIVGLIAFGAIVVTMYQKVGWFRKGINAMWSGIKTGFGWVKDNWPLLLVILTGPIGLAVVLITKNFDKIRSGVGKIGDAFGAAKDTIGSIWGGLVDIVTNPLDSIKKALNFFFKGIDKIASFFGLSFNFRFDVDGDKPKKSKPTSSDKGKDDAMARRNSGGYAKGGVLPGWSPGRDVHHFTSPTAGNLHLSGGESIMVPEWTAMMGGPKAIAAQNAAARKGQAFANGGVVWPTKSKHWTTYPRHDGIDLNGPGNGMGDPYFAAKAGTVAYTGWDRGYGHAVFLATNGGPTLTYGHSSRVDVKAGQKVAKGARMGLIGSTGNSSGPHLHFGLVGEGPDEGAAAVAFLGGAKMPSGGGSSDGGFNPLSEIKSLIRETKDLTEDIGAGPFGQMLKKAPGTIGGFAADWAKKKLNPIDDIADGLRNISPFDDGGIAATKGLLVKNTNLPERVLSPAQTAAFERAMSGGFGEGQQEFRLSGKTELVNGEAYIEGVATKVVDRRESSNKRDARFYQS